MKTKQNKTSNGSQKRGENKTIKASSETSKIPLAQKKKTHETVLKNRDVKRETFLKP